MTSERKDIRDGLRAVIVAAQTGVGDRVYENRVHPFRHKSLPAVSIFTRSEDVRVNSEGPRLYVREVEAVVQVVIDGEKDVDDRCDLLCGEVEDAIELSSLVADLPPLARLELVRIEGPELDRDGTRTICGANLVYVATYEQEITFDDDDLVDLTRVDTEVETHAPRTGPELTDTLTLPE